MATDARQQDATPRKRRIQAVDHAIDVLECLARSSGAVGVSEIARQTDLSKATVYHLLATLEDRRLVMREPDSPTYRLGWALYELGSGVAESSEVSRVARPFLDRLAAETGESVLLGVMDEDSVLYLARGDAPRGFHMIAAAGGRSPLHTTASGKLLLAYADEEKVEDYLGHPLEGFTPNTVTDRAELESQLEEIREQGFATCWQERELGLCSIAVPLRDHTTLPVASLTLAGPAGRLTDERVEEYLEPLRTAAAEIDALLGFNKAVVA
ncbi:MAG: IclR family transcriptional regulator [Actinobacteria bacterium]|nr:IclR family transcriptional regulator [Actinomycetota bacterium]